VFVLAPINYYSTRGKSVETKFRELQHNVTETRQKVCITLTTSTRLRAPVLFFCFFVFFVAWYLAESSRISKRKRRRPVLLCVGTHFKYSRSMASIFATRRL
jgi:hypothetical protein